MAKTRHGPTGPLSSAATPAASPVQTSAHGRSSVAAAQACSTPTATARASGMSIMNSRP